MSNTPDTTDAYRKALNSAYLAGFSVSGEGYNGEWGIACPEDTPSWVKDRDNALSVIIQQFPPTIPEGWQLVPKEPTPEMLNAASWYAPGVMCRDYRRMLAAAPKPPKGKTL